MSVPRPQVRLARNIALALCALFLVGSRWVDPAVFRQYPQLTTLAIAVLLAVGLAVGWILLRTVGSDLKSWRRSKEER